MRHGRPSLSRTASVTQRTCPCLRHRGERGDQCLWILQAFWDQQWSSNQLAAVQHLSLAVGSAPGASKTSVRSLSSSCLLGSPIVGFGASSRSCPRPRSYYRVRVFDLRLQSPAVSQRAQWWRTLSWSCGYCGGNGHGEYSHGCGWSSIDTACRRTAPR
jgi:hypothetical protein